MGRRTADLRRGLLLPDAERPKPTFTSESNKNRLVPSAHRKRTNN